MEKSAAQRYESNVVLIRRNPNDCPWTTSEESGVTKLEKSLRREILIGEKAYTLTIDPAGLKIVEKGRRNGLILSWKDLINGDAAIAAALQASVAR